MRLELALMSFHYLNRRRNSNPSPTSTTNPTKNPRSPPPSSSNSSFIPYHPRHQLEKHSVRPSISINPGRGIPTPPTLVSSPFGGMKGPPLSFCIESWRPEAMRTHTERTMWHCWPPMELISLSSFQGMEFLLVEEDPNESDDEERRLVISRPRTASIDSFSPAASSFQESYSIRLTRNIGHWLLHALS